MLLAAGRAPKQFLACHMCKKIADCWNVSSVEFTWSLKLRCTACFLDWYVCTTCSSSGRNAIYKTRGAALRHEKKCHQALPQLPSPAAANIDYESLSNFSTAVLDNAPPQETTLTFGTPADPLWSTSIAETRMIDFWKQLTISSKFPNFDLNISGEPSQEYFKYESKSSGLGAVALVCKSQFGYFNPEQTVSPEDIELQIAIADILFELTTNQRIKLTSIFDGIIKYQERVQKQNYQSVSFLRIPTSIHDVRQMITEGKNAIVPNLPHPQLRVLPQGHSYMTLRSAIADLLAHGVEIDIDGYVNPTRNGPVQQLGDAPQFQNLYENARRLYSTPVIALWGVEWSDDFEPNSQAKQNRGSAWVKTVTIATPHARIHSTDNTYVIAIGRKGTSHEEVERLFANELKTLVGNSDANMFYCGKIKRQVRVHFQLIASLQDSPERRGANCVSLGGSTYTAVWGMAMDLNAFSEGVPSCINCLNRRLAGRTGPTVTPCPYCVDWTFDRDTGLLDFPPPKHYPQDQVPASGKLRPLNLSHESMKCASRIAHTKVKANEWQEKNAEAYLRVNGFNGESITGIVYHASKARNLEQAFFHRVTDPVTHGIIIEDYTRSPTKYNPWPFPAVLDREISLSQHIDVVMHILFLNGLRNTVQLIHKFAASHNKLAALQRYGEGKLEVIEKLGLSWCKILPFNQGTLGGWVSENCLAMARIMRWFYGPLRTLKEPPPYSLPNKPYTQWLLKEIKDWMKSRGFKASGNKIELQAKLHDYMTQEGGPPPIAPKFLASAKLAENVIINFSAMVAHLMIRTIRKQNIEEADRHVKLYLSSLEALDKPLREYELAQEVNAEPRAEQSTKTAKPTWMQRYNLVSLLNLPKVMEQFGSLRLLWEGAGLGEGILKELKCLVDKSSSSWPCTTHLKFLRHKSMNRLRGVSSENQKNIQTNRYKNWEGMFRRYQKKDRAKLAFMAHQPLSVLHLKDERFILVLQSNVLQTCLSIEKKEAVGYCMGLAYFRFSLGNDEESFCFEDVLYACLLLPGSVSHGLPEAMYSDSYCVISSEWEELYETNKMVKYRVPEAHYEKED